LLDKLAFASRGAAREVLEITKKRQADHGDITAGLRRRATNHRGRRQVSSERRNVVDMRNLLLE